MAMGRKVADCRKMGSNCTVTIAGREDEVMKLAVSHAVRDHGEKDSPELRNQIRQTLADEA
jgi:predicted small metal-binding protein